MQDQPPEMLEQVNALRKLITDTEPSVVESLKWNAPNFSIGGEDRLTLNLMNKEGKLKLILHMGSAKKENKNGQPVLADDHGLVQWNSDIRGMITFADVKDINSKIQALQQVIVAWLKIPT